MIISVNEKQSMAFSTWRVSSAPLSVPDGDARGTGLCSLRTHADIPTRRGNQKHTYTGTRTQTKTHTQKRAKVHEHTQTQTYKDPKPTHTNMPRIHIHAEIDRNTPTHGRTQTHASPASQSERPPRARPLQEPARWPLDGAHLDQGLKNREFPVSG